MLTNFIFIIFLFLQFDQIYRRLTGKDVKNKQKYDWRTFRQENLNLSSFL